MMMKSDATSGDFIKQIDNVEERGVEASKEIEEVKMDTDITSRDGVKQPMPLVLREGRLQEERRSLWAATSPSPGDQDPRSFDLELHDLFAHEHNTNREVKSFGDLKSASSREWHGHHRASCLMPGPGSSHKPQAAPQSLDRHGNLHGALRKLSFWTRSDGLMSTHNVEVRQPRNKTSSGEQLEERHCRTWISRKAVGK